jgi:hypothetical protein
VKTWSKIVCAGCKKRIPNSQPDFMLEELATGKMRFYHRRCTRAMFARIAEKPAVYHLCFRHIAPEAN